MAINNRQPKGALEVFLTSKAVLAVRTLGSLASLAILLVGQADIIRLIAGVVLAALLIWFIIEGLQRIRGRSQDNTVYTIEARKYGYGYEELTVKAYLADKADGSMTSHRRVHLKTTSVQNHIRHYLHTLNPEVQDPLKVTGLHCLEPDGTKVDVKRLEDLSRPSGMVIDVSFDPPLNRGETAIYEVKEQFPPGSFATNRLQMAEMNLKSEHLAWHIDKPTKRIHFEVHIPNTLNPIACEYAVWYGIYSRQTHRAEWARVGPYFTVDTAGQYTTLKLDVHYPVLGLDYVLIWQY